ncbi:MAG: ATP-dependent zinc metalloprotease FtsH [Candidatus Dormibacteria bacterium]
MKGRAASQDKKEQRGGSRIVTRTVVFLAISLLALLGLYAAALTLLQPATQGSEQSFDTIINAAEQRNVPSARLLMEDGRVLGTARLEGRTQDFWMDFPDAATPDLLKTFITGKTKVSVDAQQGKKVVRFVAQFLLPLVILANLFVLFFSLLRGGGTGTSEFLRFGRVGDKRMGKKRRSPTTFADVAAAEDIIPELAEIRDYLAKPSGFAAMGALPPKGVLLVGPPGCGKTLLARAISGEADASFYPISGSEFVESLVGIGAARVRDLFRQARATPPALIFIDELDAVGRQRGAGLGGGHDEREQTLNELLVQIDGFDPTEGVVVIGATNRPDILDAALLRAGRFDRHITVDRPDREGRLAILRLHLKGRRLGNPELDLPVIAQTTAGFTGADLANVLNEAALLAVRAGAPMVARDHLEEAVERVLAGPKRRGQLISPEEKSRIGYHEAGHALMAVAKGKGATLQKLSIVARGRGIGHLAVLHEDKTILTMGDMQTQVAIAMAGIAAEELVFGEPSTGSEQDLERATNTARDMAGRYGMSSRLGRVRVLREQREVFLGRDYLRAGDVSQPTLEHLDAEVRQILDEQEEIVRSVLVAHRHILDNLAAALLEKETLQGVDLARLLQGIRPHLKVAHEGGPAAP